MNKLTIALRLTGDLGTTVALRVTETLGWLFMNCSISRWFLSTRNVDDDNTETRNIFFKGEADEADLSWDLTKSSECPVTSWPATSTNTSPSNIPCSCEHWLIHEEQKGIRILVECEYKKTYERFFWNFWSEITVAVLLKCDSTYLCLFGNCRYNRILPSILT